MTVIATVGLPGSGKGEAATVAEELEIPVVVMGDIIREECRKRDLDPSIHHGEVAKDLREENGPAAIAELSLPRIKTYLRGNDIVLVDGIRSDKELEIFREEFDGFQLISIEAPFETRLERLDDRERDSTDTKEKSLRKREQRELDFGMGEAMDQADIQIKNTGSLEEFHERIKSLLTEDVQAP